MIFSNEFLMMGFFFQSAKKIPEQNRPKIRNISSKKDWKWFFSNFLKIIISRIMTDSELDRQKFRKLSSRFRIGKVRIWMRKKKIVGVRDEARTHLFLSHSLSNSSLSSRFKRAWKEFEKVREREFWCEKERVVQEMKSSHVFSLHLFKKFEAFWQFFVEKSFFVWLEFWGDKFFIPMIEILNCCLLDLFSLQVLVISLLSQWA